MKAISLTQPWASLVAIGAKRIETRSWYTNHRGPLAIHASKRFPHPCRELCHEWPFKEALNDGDIPATLALHAGDPEHLPLGAVLATCRLVACLPTNLVPSHLEYGSLLTDRERAFGDHTSGRYAWVLEDVVALPEPIPARGALGLWEWEWEMPVEVPV